MTRTPLRQRRIPALVALAAATLTASLGISIASVLLPRLTATYAASIAEVQWVVLGYLMSITAAIVPAGRMGDIIGHRRMLIFGLAVFTCASALCGASPSLGWLIIWRGVQGLAGAILIALPMSIARDLMPKRQLGMAMGLLGTMSALGTALGPSAGGLVVAAAGWQLAFHLLALTSGATLVLAVVFVRPAPHEAGHDVSSLDLPGTVFLAIAVAVYALATSGNAGGFPVGPKILIPLAALCIILFLAIERRAAAPLVPVGLLLTGATGAALLMNLFVGTIMMSTLVIGPFFLAFHLGLDDAEIGLVLAIGPVIGAIAGLPAGRLTDWLGAGRTTLIALIHMTFGLLCLALFPRMIGLGGYVLAMAILTPSFQLFLAANNTAVLAAAASRQRGLLSGLLGLSRNLGLMSGASVMSALFVTYLGAASVEQVAPADIAFAFSATFTTAAGLAAVTLVIAIVSHGQHRHGTATT
ncbi:MFS transporter [Paracoccus sp. Z330]|uniref:MFS transporter n=1 Tax=Paracoccus onchidii TaxID=3017813 RepID=A0ABT4ZH64_9RHOB|nr:MFS transporter [Paracoccus onchidii]MDB6178702.1 MFS transporter [Paracoccus onchidii]